LAGLELPDGVTPIMFSLTAVTVTVGPGSDLIASLSGTAACQ
jgi:hypothetical protein